MIELHNLVGQNVEIARFGSLSYWTGVDPMTIKSHPVEMDEYGSFNPVATEDESGSHVGIEWEYPRQFSGLNVLFVNRSTVPQTDNLRVQYWQRNWPPGYHGGWTAVDDPYNGQWIDAHCEMNLSGGLFLQISFDPLDITEIRHAEDFAVTYRQSYRIRILFKDGATPTIQAITVQSDSLWQIADLQIDFSGTNCKYDGNIDVFNGCVLSKKETNPSSLEVSLLYAETHNYGVNRSVPWEPDRTVVTVSAQPHSFSFLVTDALQGIVKIPDLGVTATRLSAHLSPDSERGLTIPIYDRILTEPEQSYERASREIPHVNRTTVHQYGRYVPIGCEANRQEFAIRYNGEIFADKEEMKVTGRDTARLLWPGKSIFFKFPTGDPPDFRYREDGTKQCALDGCLPIYTSEWKDREFAYETTSFAALLSESPWDEDQKRGDEPIVALSRVKIRNTTEEKRKVRFWMVIENPEKLYIDDQGFVYATGRAYDVRVPDAPTQKRWFAEKYPTRRLRARIDIKSKGTLTATPCTYEPLNVSGIPNAAAYDIELEPRSSHEIDISIPFITFTGDNGRSELLAADFDTKHVEMRDYWHKQIGAGGSIQVPERDITDFIKATIPHIGITADKDIKTGYYMLPAGTFRYPVCMNEACHQIRSLDYRGHHDRARKYLQPFYELQGTQGMHGRFQSKDGVFHGLQTDEYTNYQGFNYNLDHGYVLFAMCEHYLLTRDKVWLNDVAHRLIDACDFVTRERQSTMTTDSDGTKSWEYGLLPPGHLEDNPEWLYWYAVNAYCYRGMKASADVLADIDQPEAQRLAQDAEAYRQDIYYAMTRSAELAPVVRLADGTFTPMVPTRAQLRGRDIGWIRDSLYPALHAIECGVLEPNDDLSTWMLKDTEDNVFVSRYRGRQVDLDRFWFSHGGNTIQSGLLPIVMIYLKRNQPEHAIRALFNGFAQNIYRDVRCFIEHPVEAFGLGAGPFYKTPDENCWINWLRNCLMMERGDCLRIAPGVPRQWFAEGFSADGMATYFGQMSYSVAMKGSQIAVNITPPKRNPPKSLEINFRHPDKKPVRSVSINGQQHNDFTPDGLVILGTPDLLPDTVNLAANY